MNSRVLIAICIAIAALTGRVRADDADALKKAQAFFDQAQTDYLQGRYDEAAKEFQDAYAARPFPQFLYNVGASFHMKGKKASDVEAYGKAVEFYKKYLSEEPNAADKPKVEKAVGVLEAEIKRLKEVPAAGSGAGSGAPTGPSQEVQSLGEVKVRGLVVIESEPQGATIYLDDTKKGAFATTPWSGSLDGEHKIMLEKKGYRPVDTTIIADPTKLVVYKGGMSQDSYLSWLDVTSNVAGADVFIDDKSVAPRKAPTGTNVAPGKHIVWVSAEGYDEYQETVDVAPGQNYTVKALLKGSPLGRLDVVGLGIEDSAIFLDDKPLCDHGPCIKNVPEGDHTLTVTRPGYKSYTKKITIQQKQETSVKMIEAPEASRSDAVVAYVLTAVFAGGGIYAGLQASDLHDQLKKEIAAGMPPPDSNDPRFLRGKIYAISADAAFTLAGITALTAVYYTFRDKGPPTRAQIDARAIAVTPEIGRNYAGLGMEVHW
ncbi:MAG: PEGA domain-containing protein [Deltaproteobacteria bacterium]|nr:PEGA domain-containing protein [Deltaproteobacteria bacterium]